MKTSFKKFITVLLLGGLFLSTHLPNTFARHIGSLNGIWVQKDYSVHTDYLEKTIWNGWYVVNLSGTSGNDKIWSRMINSNGEARSEWNTTLGGTRDNYYTFGAKEGYLYKLELKNYYDGSTDIYGSWSPDHY